MYHSFKKQSGKCGKKKKVKNEGEAQVGLAYLPYFLLRVQHQAIVKS